MLRACSLRGLRVLDISDICAGHRQSNWDDSGNCLLGRDLFLDPREAHETMRGMGSQDLYRELEPPAEWGHAVVCRWEQRVSVERVQRVMPDGCADLLVYESGIRQVVGLADVVAYPLLKTGTCIHGIRFRADALATLFGVDASALRNAAVELADIVGERRAQRLEDPAAIDSWIRSAIPDPRVTAAITLLHSRSVFNAAAEIGISTRHLQRIVLSHTGLSPKAFQRILRFQRFLTYAGRGDGLALAAAAAGYADQAHMSREVRRLTHLSPTTLLGNRTAH
jgi:AraC-like DNA-binding protein